MPELMTLGALLAGGILLLKTGQISYRRYQAKDRLHAAKAALISGGAYDIIEDYVDAKGVDPRGLAVLKGALHEKGFHIKTTVLKGLVEEAYRMDPALQKVAISQGGAYHVVERYAKKFGDDLREMARLRAVLLEYGFKVEEQVLRKLIEEEHQLYLRIRAIVNPKTDDI